MRKWIGVVAVDSAPALAQDANPLTSASESTAVPLLAAERRSTGRFGERQGVEAP